MELLTRSPAKTRPMSTGMARMAVSRVGTRQLRSEKALPLSGAAASAPASGALLFACALAGVKFPRLGYALGAWGLPAGCAGTCLVRRTRPTTSRPAPGLRTTAQQKAVVLLKGFGR